MSCPACGADAPESFRVGDLNRRLSRDEFVYRRCRRCGLVFLRPVPADLARYYPPDYYRPTETAAQLASESEREQYKVDLVRRFVQPGPLLEIGSGRGGFAYRAKQAGFEVTVIEMDEESCRFLTRELEITALPSDDPAAVLVRDEREYAAIALWHVVEHLADPWRVLDAAARRLRPGGVLVIATPDPDSLQFRVFGRRWLHLDAPRHLQLIPKRLLVEKARAARLEPELVTTRDEGAPELNAAGWQATLMNLTNGPRTRLLAMWAGRALELAARPFERRGDRGAAYVIVFRRSR